MNLNALKRQRPTSSAHDLEAIRRQAGKGTAAAHRALSDCDYVFIRDLIYRETRINLGDSKRELVTARLGKRLRATGIKTFGEYCKAMKNDPHGGELYHLIDAISTNHTFFFREINHFNFLQQHILPEFEAGKLGSEREFKVWSCACSTGEEPYSISIALAEHFEKSRSKGWKLDCSDISTRVLDFASKGIYEHDKLQQVKPEWQRKYFQKGERQMEGYYRIHPNIQKHINFQRVNLFGPQYPWTEKFDVIFCRNVMIYFDRKTQEELVARLAQYLRPGGYLLIGHAESLAGINHPYTTVKPAIYQLPG